MSTTTNEEWILTSYPKEEIQADNFEKRTCSVEKPGLNQVLIKVLNISVDPYLRIKLYPNKAKKIAAAADASQEEKDEAESEFDPFKIGEAPSSFCVGEVVEKGNSVTALSPGDWVTSVMPWKKYALVDAATVQKLSQDLSPSAYLNVIGLIGLSTFFPLFEIGQPQAGNTVFISGAAGAVGSLAGQLCKAVGATVIGSCGSDNKVEALKSLGFDHAFNYKTKTIDAALDKFAPEGIDVYWDNVGGPVLDAVLPRMKRHGRIVACGSISQYHVLGKEEQYGLKNYMSVVTNCIKYQGFLAFDYVPRAQECYSKLGMYIKSGKVKPLETIKEGFDKVPEAFIGLFHGENLGKMLIKVADPSSTSPETQQQQQEEEGLSQGAEGEESRATVLEKEIAETRMILGISKGRAQEALQSLLNELEVELQGLQSATISTTSSTQHHSSSQQKEAAAERPSSSSTTSSTRPRITSSSPITGLAPTYTSINSFGWDQGEYNAPWVSVYVTLEGVGDLPKEQITCYFTSNSFDLKVAGLNGTTAYSRNRQGGKLSAKRINGLNGTNYRLFKDNLDKNIVPQESKYTIKKNRVTISLKKVKGEFSYDHWSDLTAKRKKPSAAAGGADPMGGMMSMMKDLYDEGDDSMKKVIAEAMMKAQRGEKGGSGLPAFGDE